MNLTEGFELLATAPDGVARLRELILSLAVRGKLVPQDPQDESASELLRKIRAEKDRLIKEGNIKRDKPLEDIAEDEAPYAIPQSWAWARFGELGTIGSSSRVHQRDWTTSGVPFYRAREIVQLSKNDFVANDLFITIELFESLSHGGLVPERDDIMITGVGTIGVPYIVKPADKFYFKDASVLIFKNRFCLDPNYLSLFLKSPDWVAMIHAESMGTTVHTLTIGRAIETPIPLPSLAEQSRIVAKVDELMSLCDELETRGRLEMEQHARLTATLFETLAESESAHTLAENWSRIATHFDLLLDRPETVDALEQTILQLAVRGLLVPQKSGDEPASVLLEQVQAARDELVAQGKAGRSTTPSASDDVRKPNPMVGWESVTLPDLCVIGGGATPSKSKAAYWEGTLPWVSPKDMKVEFIADAQDHVSELALEETRLPLVPASSLLIVVRGMILAHSFPVGVTQVEVTINQDMKSLTPLLPALVPYLALVCRGFKREILSLVDRSTHGTCKLQSDKLFAFRFGLPPLAEQSRILARVETLRYLCTELRERLTARQTCHASFADAVVEQAESTVPSAVHTDNLAAAA